MADNKNTQGGNANDGLRGGTEGGGKATVEQSGTPGGTNSLTPAGGSHVAATPEPPTGDKAAAERQDPKRAVEGGRTMPSASAAKQRARDEANIPPEESQSGIDAGNPRQIPENAPNPDGRTGND